MSNTQIVNQPYLYVDRLSLSWASTTTLSGTAGAARDSTNVYDIQISSTTTINSAINGANGLDTGDMVADTYYAVYVIGDTTNTNPGAYLLSTSQTEPTLPYGYDVFRRIGQTKTDGASHFLLFWQSGGGNQKKYFWDQFFDTGTSTGTTTFTQVFLNVLVPPSADVAIMLCGIVPNVNGDAIFLRRTGSTTNSSHIFVTGPSTTGQSSNIFEMPVDSEQSIEYKTSSASDTPIIIVAGFIDNL
jgi:hypothetical protein